MVNLLKQQTRILPTFMLEEFQHISSTNLYIYIYIYIYIYVCIYMYQNNCTCILQSFDSDLADWILVFDALNFAGLFLLDQESNNFAENSYFTELIMLFCLTFFNLPDGWHYITRHYILRNQFNKLIRFIWFNRVS